MGVGAVARITCEGVDEYGYETESLSILSCATDEKGYFIATISPYEVKDQNQRFRNCKAFLELSPSEDCDVPTDVNKGISGDPLASFQRLHDKNIKLFTVGPFFFVPKQEAKSIPDDGYWNKRCYKTFVFCFSSFQYWDPFNNRLNIHILGTM